MRATYKNVQAAGNVNGVEYATAEATFAKDVTVKAMDRMSAFKLFQELEYLQQRYGILEGDMDKLLLLFKDDAQQQILESEIE